jgi:hypothetical protein
MQTIEDDPPFDRIYRWRNNDRRRHLYGRRCRVLAKGSTMNSCLVEFENGQRHIVSWRALRKVRDG